MGASFLASGSLASPVMASSASGSRTELARDVRIDRANVQFAESDGKLDQRSNGDDERYESERYYASFTKTLPHNDFGEVRPDAYQLLINAIESSDPASFDLVPLSPGADLKLANPQGAFRFVLAGLDGHSTRMRLAPTFRSTITAAEMGEVYWLALTRDIAFNDYASNNFIGLAIDDLNGFTATVGPKVNGNVNAATLFRGETAGDLAGPYVSQFLFKDVPYGPTTIVQRYKAPVANENFMTDLGNWIMILRGQAPTKSLNFRSGDRYIYNNRTLGEYVHGDVLFQAYFNALLIALSFGGDAVDDGNPYFGTTINQGAFTSLGGPWMIDLLTQAANLGLAGAWCQKWLHHRRLRPEVYSGRIHFEMAGLKDYEVQRDILNSDVLNRVYSRNGNYLLPMAYPEGSPTHPAYPAGHATIAGACVTVLKGLFNEDFVIPNPVESNRTGTSLVGISDDLTLGGELNKLAANMSLGRDAAGVHYRSDGISGLDVGEQQAIALLEDHSVTLNENFGGFSLTKFDGTKILILDGQTSEV